MHFISPFSCGGPYVYQTSYDSDGRVASVTYPSGFVAQYVYTSLSYLSQIKDQASGTAYWTANTRDAELHLTQQTAGNSVVTNQTFDPTTGLVQTIKAGTSNAVANFAYGFDLIGDLLSRSDANESVSEKYCYDTLNRLQYSATGTSGAVPSTCTSSGTNIIDKTLVYDALGNISSKSDVGTYAYGSGTTLPHAVTSVTGSYLGLTNPVLAYDADGNMTCTSTAANCTGTIGRQVAYTSFNMTASVTQGTTLICFAYDSDHARITQTATTTSNSCASPGTSAVTTTYLNDPTSGAIEEAVSQPGMALVWRDYVQADGHIVALRTTTYTGSGTRWGAANWGSFNWSATTTSVSVLYFTLDHLGSIAVVTNASGTVVERDSYDAWGKRRNANGTDVSTCSIASQTTRGFTNQEMMDQVCLVNLNARLYDPILGRFLAADPVIGTPFVPQELNRYTYVLDDPLSLTDPTGLCFLGCFWKSPIFAAVLDIAIFFIAPELEGLNLFGSGGLIATAATGDLASIGILALNGGIAGGLSAAVAGGNVLRGALTGAFQAGATFGLGGYLGGANVLGAVFGPTVGTFVAQGVVGGLVSVAQGGNFGSGFLAGGVGTLGPGPTALDNWEAFAENDIIRAILGGAASVLGGGKFANGAITAAFAYAAASEMQSPNQAASISSGNNGSAVGSQTQPQIRIAQAEDEPDDSLPEQNGQTESGAPALDSAAGQAINQENAAEAAGQDTKQTDPGISQQQLNDLTNQLLDIGGGAPQSVPTQKGATQFIFPNGTVLRFDLSPGQYLPGQTPHINLQNVPGSSNPNYHIPVG